MKIAALPPDGRISRPHLRGGAYLAAALLLSLGPFVHAQQANTNTKQDQKIRVNVNVITARFSAKDLQGQFVDSLKESDFRVYENGSLRRIAFFEPPRRKEGDNQQLWLAFLLDVSGSTFATRAEEIVAAQTFLDNVNSFTRVGIFGFTDKLLTFQGFTTSREAASRAFSEAHRHLGQTAIYSSINSLISEMNREAGAGGRKVIIVLSDGMDKAYRLSSQSIALARASRTTVYTILVPSATQLYISPTAISAGPEDGQSPQSGQTDAKKAAFLRLADTTGGKSYSGFETILDLDDTLAQINDDIYGNLYTIGYYTDDPYLGKREREIRVECSQAGVTVSSVFKKLPERLRAKKEFIAALFDNQALKVFPENLNTAFHEIGVDLDLLTPRQEGDRVGLPFRLNINPLSLQEDSGGGVRTELGIVCVLVDSEGREVVRLREIFRASLKEKDIRNGQGVIYTNRLLAPPGTYKLAMALLELPTWKMTAFEHTVTIETP